MDLTKEYQTKCGYAVECLREDGVGGYVGFVVIGDTLSAAEWESDGVCIGTVEGDPIRSPLNLIEKKLPSLLNLIEKPRTVRVKGWLNVYDDGICLPTRETADRCAGPDRIACIPIDREVTYGEGLNDD